MTTHVPGLHLHRAGELAMFMVVDKLEDGTITSDILYSPTRDDIQKSLMNHGLAVGPVLDILSDRTKDQTVFVIDAPTYREAHPTTFTN